MEKPREAAKRAVAPLAPALSSGNPLAWLTVFGPGAIVASLTIGTGELIFSTRGGVLFGYRILFLFVAISVLKWALVFATSRHMVLCGVHPVTRMMELPGPRGWFPLMLLLMLACCIPIWVSFHSSVLGNLTSWVTGTKDHFNGGIDYLWGGAILAGIVVLTASGGYSALERIQLTIVTALVLCAGVTLVLYNPDWLELIKGAFIPQNFEYPEWLFQYRDEEYVQIAEQPVWVETTRYVGVIGGAGYDYLAYTSFLRDKHWGMAGRESAGPDELDAIAADRFHPARLWVRAPLIDCTLSFIVVVAFSAVFVASGAQILRPEHKIPTEDNLLNLQAQFVTGIHPWLLPLYVSGAFLTMLGTLYGTFEIAHAMFSEVVFAVDAATARRRARAIKFITVAWCALGAYAVLCWTFVYQTGGTDEGVSSAESPSSIEARALVDRPEAATAAVSDTTVDAAGEADFRRPQRGKPRILLLILTPVNLFTGVLACGLFCLMIVWMDWRFLPRQLRMPSWLAALNFAAGLVFVVLGLKGYWDDKSRWLAIASLPVVVGASVGGAWLAGRWNTPLRSEND